MKILIHATHYAVASGRYAQQALERLGHDVRTTGPSAGAVLPWHGGVTVDDTYVWVPSPPEDGWTPSLVLHMDANLDPLETDALHVVYGVDNHVRDYRFSEPDADPFPFDHLFLGHGNGYRIGEDNVTWLPCAYDPVLFKPGPELNQRTNDAAMIGVQYAPRAELLYTLRQNLPNARILYGLGVYDQYAAAYQSARVSLVRSARDDVAQRVWETAAMGNVVLMDRVHDCEALGLVDGETCLLYDTPVDAADKLRWVLTHTDEAQAIADAGREWAQDGTWDARLSVIVEWAEQQLGVTAQKAADSDD